MLPSVGVLKLRIFLLSSDKQKRTYKCSAPVWFVSIRGYKHNSCFYGVNY